MMHQQTASLLYQVKTSTGEYIWQQGGPATGTQGERFMDRLRGYPVFINNQMNKPGNGSGDTLIVFGQLRKYHVRKVNEIQFQRLSELYALNGQVGLLAWGRWDGNLIDAGTHPVKCIVNP